MKPHVFLWLLAMVAGLGLMMWLVPPREIEARLKEHGLMWMSGTADDVHQEGCLLLQALLTTPGELKVTRMEFRLFTGPMKGREYHGQPGEYHSTDGYGPANGMRAAI
jgi:hypothetical protein